LGGELVLTPAGHLTWRETAEPGASPSRPGRLANRFAEGSAAGLFHLDAWAARQAKDAGGVSDFLAASAPRWRHVGRVCFHLAENPQDQEHPFAFMATFSSGMMSGSL